jgi:P27 family predicted phage terminase small subunit
MTASARPEPPINLGEAGIRLWGSILADLDDSWQLDARELHLLERACRVEDEMRKLEAVVDQEGATSTGSKGQVVVHPAVLEGRQLKLAQLRLLGSLELADPKTGNESPTAASRRASKAAGARWRKEQGYG